MAYQVQYPILSLPAPVLSLNYVAYPNVERNKILTRPTGAEAIGFGILQKVSYTFVRLPHIVHSMDNRVGASGLVLISFRIAKQVPLFERRCG
jgi:hypothetical protein